MNFGSLFSGIGGINKGLEDSGMTCKWQVEIDDFCTKVLTKHWPNVPKFGDIRDVGKRELETVDLIAGGFPCQPFSVAGKRKGTEDDRHLWPEMLRVISELKPTWVLGENVPGIIPIFLDQAISDLEAEGYTCETFVLPACAFDAPHRRDRLFIIAHSNQHGKSIVTFNEKEGQGELGNLENSRCALRERGKEHRKSDRKTRNTSIQPQRSSGTSRLISNTKPIRCGQMESSIISREERKRTADQTSDSSITRRWSRWLPEPGVGQVAHGIPDRVDRLKGLGNAVVPQVIEHIGRMIMEANK